MHKVQGENVDTAGHSGQSTDDGGENTETTSTEQKVLPRNVHLDKLQSYSPWIFICIVVQDKCRLNDMFK